MDLLQAGLRYINRGVAPIPVWRDRRKNPYLFSVTEFLFRLPNYEEWRRWANRWPNANIGLITGYWGLVALDFDTEESYTVWCEGPGQAIRGQTWTTRTARGYHVWFEFVGNPGPSRSYTYQGHEVLLRARGGYCIVPPSIHHSGVPYRTVHRVEPYQLHDLGYYLRGWELKQKEQKSAGFCSGQSVAVNFSSRIEELIPIPEGSRPNNRGAYKVRCPFHDDQTPSAWLNIDQQRFGCNACWPGKWWDTANVIAMLNNISNEEAYKQLKTAIPQGG